MRRYLATFAAGVLGGLSIVHRAQRDRTAAQRLAAAALETLLNAIDANDAATGAHVRRVAAYSVILAEAAELEESDLRSIERVALFHDIGKIHAALFDIVHESSRLTPREWRAIVTHPARGARVLSPISEFYPELASGVLAHHERWDGTGYPRRLRGTQIPIAARIVSLADTFDVVTHSRRYHRGQTVGRALHALAAGRGTQFDPELVDLFLLPPVTSRIVHAMRGRYPTFTRAKPAAPAGVSSMGGRTPAVSFRWRTASRVRPLPGPQPTAHS
ncbi:MAG: hypothetical protein NVS4B3_04180 [Gemmatimonadaceae bacterium]